MSACVRACVCVCLCVCAAHVRVSPVCVCARIMYMYFVRLCIIFACAPVRVSMRVRVYVYRCRCLVKQLLCPYHLTSKECKGKFLFCYSLVGKYSTDYLGYILINFFPVHTFSSVVLFGESLIVP